MPDICGGPRVAIACLAFPEFYMEFRAQICKSVPSIVIEVFYCLSSPSKIGDSLLQISRRRLDNYLARLLHG